MAEHYRAHKGADPQLTFFGFLYEHYIIADNNDPDHLADMQLPFKSSDNTVVFKMITVICIPGEFKITIKPVISELSSIQVIERWNLLPAHLYRIWEPPKA
ncbi:MAG: hypothetical protein M3139_07710 [Bacteroidota bacterium]|nr:hypothetical protein [Bacteroidota bacterium]